MSSERTLPSVVSQALQPSFESLSLPLFIPLIECKAHSMADWVPQEFEKCLLIRFVCDLPTTGPTVSNFVTQRAQSRREDTKLDEKTNTNTDRYNIGSNSGLQCSSLFTCLSLPFIDFFDYYLFIRWVISISNAMSLSMPSLTYRYYFDTNWKALICHWPLFGHSSATLEPLLGGSSHTFNSFRTI